MPRRISYSLTLCLLMGLLFPLSQAFAGNNDGDDSSIAIEQMLREASEIVPTIPDKFFSSHGQKFIKFQKLTMLEDIAEVQAKVRDQEGLRETAAVAIQASKGQGHAVYSLTIIGNAQVNAGFVDDGVNTAEASLEIVLSCNEKPQAMDSYFDDIFGLFLRAENFSRATETAQMFSTDFEKANAFEAIASHQSKAGLLEQAKQLRGQSTMLASTVDDLEKNARFLYYRAIHQVRAHKLDSASKTLAQAKIIARKIHESEKRASLLRQIATEQKKTGDVDAFHASIDEVITEIDMIRDARSRVVYYLDVVDLLKEQSEVERARQLIDRAFAESQLVTDPFDKTVALAPIAKAQWQIGESEKAEEIMHLSLNSLQEIKRSGTRVLALTLLWSNGGSKQLLSSELGTIENIVEAIPGDDVVGKAYALKTLAVIQVRNGLMDQALATANRIQQGPEAKGYAIKEIAKFKGENEEFQIALSWANGLASPIDKVNALIGLADGLLSVSDS